MTLTGLTAVLLVVMATPAPGGVAPAPVDGPPPCPSAPIKESDADERQACQARPNEMTPADGDLPASAPGYHHLGATSSGPWSGVLGRVTVRDPAVRAGTHDFVATRFMAKREVAGKLSWLEAGWAETGWSGEGRQRVYTFDTRRNSWTFYDQYPLREGDQIWLYVHTETVPVATEPGGPARPVPVWQAWLWWRGEWHLLTSAQLPLGTTAQVEQYVEVYVDPRHSGGGYQVPRVPIDSVQVKTAPNGGLRRWGRDVPTSPGRDRGRYCLRWHSRFHSWDAGDCAAGTAGTTLQPAKPGRSGAQED